MTGRRGGRWRALAAVGASVALSGCWLQPGFDASRTRWNPVEHRITTVKVPDLAEAWSVDVEAPEVYEPLVYGGRVFVGRQASEDTGGGVLALDAATGGTLWDRTTTPAAEYVFAQPPAFVEGELWSSWWQSFEEPGRCESGTVRLDPDGNVVGHDHAGVPWSSPVQSGRYVVQNVYPECPSGIPLPGTTLTVRDSRTLETLWTADAGMQSISGGQILGGESYPLAGCGAPTCTSTIHAEWPSAYGQPYIARPRSDVFGVRGGFGGPNGEVFALSRDTGAVVWRAAVNAVTATLAADDDHLFVAAGGRVLVFDVDGCGGPSCRPLWSATGSGTILAVAGDVVYAAGNGTVRAFPADGCGRSTCEEIGRVDVEGTIRAMAVAEGRLVVTSEIAPGQHRVTAFAP